MFSINSFLRFPCVLADLANACDTPTWLWRHVLAVIVFSLVGIAMLGACFWIMKKLTPFSVAKEIEQDHNVALAVLMGSVIIGMALIIAAAILG